MVVFVLNPHDPTLAAMMAVIRPVYDDVNYHEAPHLVFQGKFSNSVQYLHYVQENKIPRIVVIINMRLFYSNPFCTY